MAKKQVPRPIGEYRRPRPDLYTFMLIVAFIALLVAIAALWAHMAEYDYEIKGGPSVQAPAAGTVVKAQLPPLWIAGDLDEKALIGVRVVG